ncbi:MAG: 6-phosphogluconolactonase [Chlamydiae bacterium]|nr:6-phosphogluconolactonase [Chlamydiota bacterium]
MTSITIFDDESMLIHSLVQLFKTKAKEKLKKKSCFTVALSGGKTPIPFFEALAKEKGILWDKVYLFFVDERYVPSNDQKNNGLLVKRHLIDHIKIPMKNVFYIDTSLAIKNSVLDYEKKLRSFFKKKKISFDFTLLGLGTDGHIASIFTKAAALKKEPVLITQKKEETFKRISLSLFLINQSKNIIFLVTGQEKREILRKLLVQKNKNLAASYVSCKGMQFFLDQSAAQFLLK